ncbi:MAG: CPBP family intramembrane metalloprotease [Chloroflexi bacterium]|nr:CPBP family intramembrane metalloprotease [Chloroflexota bacterium]
MEIRTSHPVTLVAAVALGCGLAAYNGVANFAPQHWHDLAFVPLNLALAVLLIGWARWRGMGWDELGFGRAQVPRGLVVGSGIGLLLGLPVFLAALVPDSIQSGADFLGNGYDGTTPLVYRAVVRIPLGTALFEEVAFRGVLFGVWRAATNLRSATIANAVFFGLWHVTPTWELMSGAEQLGSPLLLALAVLGGVVVSGVGGLFLVWLRRRTAGLVAPVMTHWFINSLGEVASAVAL